MSLIFNKIALVGIGLIGSSIVHAARRGGLVGEVAVWTRSPDTRARVRALGFADQVCEELAEAVSGADAIFVCTPVGAFGAVADGLAPYLKPGQIVSDVGSVKQTAIDTLGAKLPVGVHFVPGHPIAGTEYSGPDAGFASLFDGRWCILTPDAVTGTDAVQKIEAFWKGCGAQVEIMDAAHHDRVLAITSHLPHLIAYNIVGTAADLEEDTKREVIKFSASGFRDFTRIAASDPTMWRDVFLANQDAVLEMLGRFDEDLTALKRAIRKGDGEALFDLFARTRAIRREIIEAGQDTDAPDFGRKG